MKVWWLVCIRSTGLSSARLLHKVPCRVPKVACSIAQPSETALGRWKFLFVRKQLWRCPACHLHKPFLLQWKNKIWWYHCWSAYGWFAAVAKTMGSQSLLSWKPEHKIWTNLLATLPSGCFLWLEPALKRQGVFFQLVLLTWKVLSSIPWWLETTWLPKLWCFWSRQRSQNLHNVAMAFLCTPRGCETRWPQMKPNVSVPKPCAHWPTPFSWSWIRHQGRNKVSLLWSKACIEAQKG